MQTSSEIQFNRFLECLNEAGCLSDIVIIGSWAEHVYGKSKMLDGFNPSIRTDDADFLITNLRKPREKSDLVKVAEKAGFIYSEDSFSGDSKFSGSGMFEVEFLISQRGDGTKKLPRTNIGVNAQQLTHLNILARNTVSTSYNGLNVIVPEPEAYVLQKMAINHLRRIKAEPDRQKIYGLLPYLDETRLNCIYQQLSTKEKTRCAAYMSEYCPTISLTEDKILLKV